MDLKRNRAVLFPDLKMDDGERDENYGIASQRDLTAMELQYRAKVNSNAILTQSYAKGFLDELIVRYTEMALPALVAGGD